MTTAGLAAVAHAAESVTRADHDKAITTARAEANAEGVAAGKKEGATAERARCQAILGAKEATGRGELAQHLAFATDMAAEPAIALLGKSPAKAEAPKAGSRLDALVPSPNVAATGNEAPEANAQAGWDSAVAAVNKSIGAARQH